MIRRDNVFQEPLLEFGRAGSSPDNLQVLRAAVGHCRSAAKDSCGVPDALDSALAYYLGRAALGDPLGYFHLVSKDKGYDALIERLRSKHIRVRRHDDFISLTFSAAGKPTALTAPLPATAERTMETAPTLVAQLIPIAPASSRGAAPSDDKSPTEAGNRVGNVRKEGTGAFLIAMLDQARHVVVDDKGKVAYHLTV